jgi:hypothetical protein
MSKKNNSLHSNQRGLVSFVVVLIIMFVLSLIVLSFAQLVRREQTQTLDRQLNAQAFYAAESGVNDALHALSQADITGYNQNCTGAGSFMDTAGLDNDLGNGVSYSCLLVDQSPEELRVDAVPTDSSVVLPIRPNGADPLTELSFTVEGDAATLTGCPAFRQNPGTWPGSCSVGMLRIELVEFNGTKTRDDLMKDRAMFYMQPVTSGGDAALGWNEVSDRTLYRSGGQHPAVCTPGGARATCTFRLTGLNIRNGYLRLRSVYRVVGVAITGTASGTPVSFRGAQAEVDATGRVSGVIKRIKVTAPVPIDTGADGPLPEYALQSTETLCKRFQLAGPVTNDVQFGLFFNTTTGPNDDCNPNQTVNN